MFYSFFVRFFFSSFLLLRRCFRFSLFSFFFLLPSLRPWRRLSFACSVAAQSTKDCCLPLPHENWQGGRRESACRCAFFSAWSVVLICFVCVCLSFDLASSCCLCCFFVFACACAFLCVFLSCLSLHLALLLPFLLFVFFSCAFFSAIFCRLFFLFLFVSPLGLASSCCCFVCDCSGSHHFF